MNVSKLELLTAVENLIALSEVCGFMSGRWVENENVDTINARIVARTKKAAQTALVMQLIADA